MTAFIEQDEVRLTIAALAASVIRAAEAAVPGISANVLHELETLQRELRYSDHQRTVETIQWTRDLIRKKFVVG